MTIVFFIVNRYKCLSKLKDDIEKNEGGVEKFTRGYEKFGINRTPEGLVYREWAPAACGVYLTGDFSEWNCFDDCFFLSVFTSQLGIVWILSDLWLFQFVNCGLDLAGNFDGQREIYFLDKFLR